MKINFFNIMTSSIKRRLLIAFIGIIILLLIPTVSFIVIDRNIEIQYTRAIENMLLEYQMTEAFDNFISEYNFLLRDINNPKILSAYNAKSQKIDDIFSQLNKTVTFKKSRAIFRKLGGAIGFVKEYSKKSLENTRRGDFSRNSEIIEQINRGSDNIRNDTSSFILAELEFLNQQQQKLKIIVKLNWFLGLTLFIFVTLGGIALAFIWAGSISRPLVKLSKLAKDISEGNHELSVQKDFLKMQDEIGILAASFNNMLVNLKDRIDQEKNRVLDIKKQHSVLLDLSKEEFSELKFAFRKIIELDAKTINVERVSIWLFNKDHSKFTCSGCYTLSKNTYEMGAELLVKDYPRYFAAVEDKRVIQAEDACTYEETFELKEAYLHKLGITSLLDATIRQQGKTIGVICHEHVGAKRAWTQEELEFATSLADRISLIMEGLERKRVEEVLQTTYDQLKKSQEDLLQAAKFGAIGQLASSVAHEVRNPLGIIMQSVEYLENKVPVVYQEIIQVAKKNIKRADTIIGTLLDFSKVKQLSMEPEDINLIIEDSLALTHYSNRGRVEVVKDLGNGLPRILVDRQKMEQVFVNIFLNALQAMPGDGRLFVRTYLNKAGDLKEEIKNKIENHSGLKKDTVTIEIQDEGAGISEENMKNVFHPFFTTKGSMTGIGLGLSVAKKIIEMHDGYIGIESQPGKGAKVIITLGV